MDVWFSYVRIWSHHPIETTMLKWMSQVLKCGAAAFFLPDFARKSFPITCDFLSHVKIEEVFFNKNIILQMVMMFWNFPDGLVFTGSFQICEATLGSFDFSPPDFHPNSPLLKFLEDLCLLSTRGRPLRTESRSSESPNGWKFRWKMDPNFPSQEFPTHFNNNAENLRVDLFWGGRFCFVYPMFSSPKEEEQSDFHSRHVVTKIQDDQLSST